ncbi:MAG: pirin family protein [Spirochaetales bacterium]|nr:pirin family protein [Spirochaetales bacterium]
MKREIQQQTKGYRTQDGAGVSLVRVLGPRTVQEYDPILMLDSFDSTNPADYTAGFPLHPHRGIETISYVYQGKMSHKDSLGNEDTISDGEIQWMTAGSGILHEENLPASKRLLGVQLWLNLPAKDKMAQPVYKSIKSHEIPEITLDIGKIRILAGSFNGTKGYTSKYLPLDYYDIHLNPAESITIDTDRNRSVMLFTLSGQAYIADQLISEKTAVKLTSGDTIEIKAADTPAQILFISSTFLGEPVAWGGPIVMNTQQELDKAFDDLDKGTFLKSKISY